MKNINLMCPLNPLGYGVTGLNIVKSLSKICNLSLFPIGQMQIDEKDGPIVSQCYENSMFYDYNAPSVKIWHQNDMSLFPGKGLRIGYPIFELDDFNNIERHNLKSVDALFVCSEWAKKVIKSLGINTGRIYVVPLGVDPSIFSIQVNLNTDKTIFFNCGKWEIRKGHDVLHQIFNKAFTPNDNVELWMMNHNPFISAQDESNWQKLYTNSPMGDKIRFIPRVASHKEVYNIMSTVDCGIFPSRAEGWNLELLEMLACGKHVITTNYSAHTEFCNNTNSLLVDITNLEKAYDGKWFHGKVGNWASIEEPQIDQFVEHMRTVHNRKKRGELGLNEGGINTAREFTWDNSARKIMEYV